MNLKKILFLGSLGASLEYYDFVIYALMASTLSALFFPASDHGLALIKSYGIFALGYLARPLGGMLFGSLSDRFGRRSTFVGTIAIMAVATLGIGCLPTYQLIGSAAAYLLLLLRLLQGLSFGGEWPTAMVFITEHGPHKHRGLLIGTAACSLGFASGFAALLTYTLHHQLTTEQFMQWGWRVPFWLGGALAIGLYYLRRELQETPGFQALNKPQHGQPLKTVFRDHWPTLLRGIALSALGANLVIFALFLPSYLHEYYDYPLPYLLKISTIGLLASGFIMPPIGWLSDRIGRRGFLFVFSLIFLVGCNALFGLLDHHQLTALCCFMALYQLCLGINVCLFDTLLTELFPIQLRVTGVAFSYNVCLSAAGCLPFILSTAKHYGLAITPVSVFMTLAAMSLLATLKPLPTMYNSPTR